MGGQTCIHHCLRSDLPNKTYSLCLCVNNSQAIYTYIPINIRFFNSYCISAAKTPQNIQEIVASAPPQKKKKKTYSNIESSIHIPTYVLPHSSSSIQATLCSRRCPIALQLPPPGATALDRSEDGDWGMGKGGKSCGTQDVGFLLGYLTSGASMYICIHVYRQIYSFIYLFIY